MSLRENLLREFSRGERKRLVDLQGDEQRVSAYRGALGTLASAYNETTIEAMKSPHDAGLDIAAEMLSSGVVVEIEYGNGEEWMSVLITDVDEQLAAYVVGECWACGRPVPLAPPIDPEQAEYGAGLALAVNEPADSHRCRELRS